MEQFLDQPAVVLVLLSLAAALFVVEVALPTAGVAGTLALLLGAAAVVGIDRQDADWWPLLGPTLAVVLWAVMVATRKRSPLLEPIALVLFAAGSAGFGLLADSPAAVVVGLAITVGLGAGYPAIHGAAMRLLARPAQVGMEALVGQVGVVSTWDGDHGSVRLQGSLWMANSAEAVASGDAVEVTGFLGMTISVVPRVRPQVQGA